MINPASHAVCYGRCCCNELYFEHFFERSASISHPVTIVLHDVISIPAAAVVITTNVAQPKYLSTGEFTCFPMTLGLLVKRITSKINGGANNPLITADQNSIFTAFNPT